MTAALRRYCCWGASLQCTDVTSLVFVFIFLPECADSVWCEGIWRVNGDVQRLNAGFLYLYFVGAAAVDAAATTTITVTAGDVHCVAVPCLAWLAGVVALSHCVHSNPTHFDPLEPPLTTTCLPQEDVGHLLRV